jgi:hypothetical protein
MTPLVNGNEFGLGPYSPGFTWKVNLYCGILGVPSEFLPSAKREAAFSPV